MNRVICLLLLSFISVLLLLLFELFLCSRHVAAAPPPTAVNDDVVDYDIMPMNMMLHTLYLLFTITNCCCIKISPCGVIPADKDGSGTPSSSFYIHPTAAAIFQVGWFLGWSDIIVCHLLFLYMSRSPSLSPSSVSASTVDVAPLLPTAAICTNDVNYED